MIEKTVMKKLTELTIYNLFTFVNTSIRVSKTLALKIQKVIILRR